MATLPVDDAVSLLRAEDTKGVDGCVCRRQVCVLPRASCKASRWTLTPSKKLAHAGKDGNLIEKKEKGCEANS